MVALKVKSLVSTFQYEKADFNGGWKAALQHPRLSDTPRIIFIVNVTESRVPGITNHLHVFSA